MNYHINIFSSDEDRGYIADIPDLRHCSAFGRTQEGALAEVRKARAAWLAAAKKAGKPILAPPYRFNSDSITMTSPARCQIQSAARGECGGPPWPPLWRGETVDQLRIGIFVTAVVLAAASGAASPEIGPGAFSPGATLIDFDDLTGGSTIFTGDIVTTQYAGLGAEFMNPDFVSRANVNLAIRRTARSISGSMICASRATAPATPTATRAGRWTSSTSCASRTSSPPAAPTPIATTRAPSTSSISCASRTPSRRGVRNPGIPCHPCHRPLL